MAAASQFQGTRGAWPLVLCALALGCHPSDANIGGAFQCSEEDCFFDNVLSTDASLLFNGPEDTSAVSAPRVAYPLDESTQPRNIAELNVQWHRPRIEQRLFRIRFESAALPLGRYDFYTPCLPINDGCHYNLPEQIWYRLAASMSGRDAWLTVAASDGSGGSIAVSPRVHLHVSDEDVAGGLYYWSARPPDALPGAADQGTTYRLAFGARRASPFISPGQENPKKCEGCHAVSGNGSTIAFTATDGDAKFVNGATSGSFMTRDTSAPSQPLFAPLSDSDSAMIALNFEGTLAVVGFDNQLVLRSTATGLDIRTVDPSLLGTEGHAYFPEFSPDGRSIAVTLSDQPDAPWAVKTGEIATLSFDPGTKTFGPAQVIVPMTEQDFHYYPSWSPDGQWIVFVSAPRGKDPNHCTDPSNLDTCAERLSYDQSASRLRLVHVSDGRIYELGRATQGIGLTSTLPKFAPFITNNQMFITFNSKMNYGVQVSNSPAQLWLAAIDLDRLPDDPSSAPVWLPFQNFGQKNHLAYWSTQVQCRSDALPCGPDEFCDADGTCQVQPVVK